MSYIIQLSLVWCKSLSEAGRIEVIRRGGGMVDAKVSKTFEGHTS